VDRPCADARTRSRRFSAPHTLDPGRSSTRRWAASCWVLRQTAGRPSRGQESAGRHAHAGDAAQLISVQVRERDYARLRLGEHASVHDRQADVRVQAGGRPHLVGRHLLRADKLAAWAAPAAPLLRGGDHRSPVMIATAADGPDGCASAARPRANVCERMWDFIGDAHFTRVPNTARYPGPEAIVPRP
jgi:hypothetical protein